MKNILLILIGIVLLSSCRDESLDPRPDLEDNVGAVTLLDIDPDNNFFNALEADFGSEAVIFTVDVNGFQVTEVESVDLQLVYTEKDGAIDPFLGIVDSVYAPINLGTVTEFPSQVTVTASEVADAIGKDVDSLEVGDTFVLTLPINTADGRRLTVALASDLCNQPAQPSAGGCSVEWAVACPSSLPTGTFTAVSGGTSTDGCPPTNPVIDINYDVTITDEGGGVYTISDFSAGVYQDWYCGCYVYCFETSLTFTDICNELTLTGSDAFGAAVSGTGTYDPGTGEISMDWTNGFGDIGYWTIDTN